MNKPISIFRRNDDALELHINYDENYEFEQHNQVMLLFKHRDFNVEVNTLNAADVFESVNDDYTFTHTYKNESVTYHVYIVSAYIHSGVVLYLDNPMDHGANHWDVSRAGCVLVNIEYGDRDKGYKIAKSYINEWNNYLSGNVYLAILYKVRRFVKTYEDGKTEKGSSLSIIDSCGGFIGDDIPESDIFDVLGIEQDQFNKVL